MPPKSEILDIPGMTVEERNALLERYRATLANRFRPAKELPHHEIVRLDAVLAGLREEYAARLPRPALSRCPHCGDPLWYAIDPYGLDGLWWRADGLIESRAEPACEHFCVLLGALNLGGRPVREIQDAVEPGPEVPFVVPRLLGLPGMRAVVSSLQLGTGDRAHVIAYFAEPKPDSEELHQPWARRDYTVTDEDGVPQGFSVKTDPWDFDLAPWIESGALQWIGPGDATLALRTDGPPKCPYLRLPGERLPQLLEKGARDLLEAPDGTEVEPFE